MKVLATGFGPIRKGWTGKKADETINPSIEAVKRLNDEILRAKIIKIELPSAFQASQEILFTIIRQEQPDIVICVGQMGSRPHISVEKVAINIDDTQGKPDDPREVRTDQPIFPDGKAAYFSNLPVREIVEAIKRHSIPADISYHAGTLMCNHAMYGVLYLIDKKYPAMQGGFIHVPCLPEQVVDCAPPQASMSTDLTAKALQIAIEVTIRKSLAVGVGEIH